MILLKKNKNIKQELTLRREQQHRDYVPKPLDLSEYKLENIYRFYAYRCWMG